MKFPVTSVARYRFAAVASVVPHLRRLRRGRTGSDPPRRLPNRQSKCACQRPTKSRPICRGSPSKGGASALHYRESTPPDRGCGSTRTPSSRSPSNASQVGRAGTDDSGAFDGREERFPAEVVPVGVAAPLADPRKTIHQEPSRRRPGRYGPSRRSSATRRRGPRQ